MLIFSQFVIMLDILEIYMKINNYSMVRFDGSTKGSEYNFYKRRTMIIWIFPPKIFSPNCFWFWKIYIRKVLFSFGIINLRRCFPYVIFICLRIYLHYFLCFVKTTGSIISARLLNEKYFKTGNRIGFRVSWCKVALKICKETRIIPEENWFTVKCNIVELYI